MGSIRILLAITVVLYHSGGFMFVGGQLAVQLFYIISGFLISYVLVEAKSYRTVSAFYVNRFLRLFPIYWFVALGAIILHLILIMVFNKTHNLFPTFQSLDFWVKLGLVISNIFIVGQDWIHFIGLSGGATQIVIDFRETEVFMLEGLLIPQAWSLGVEISFYLIAPFILVRKKLMLFLLLCSIILRGYLIYLGIGTKDPWSYRFFPTELALFILGACSHQFLKPFYEKKILIAEKLTYILTITVTVIVFLYCTFYSLLPYRLFNTLFIMAVFFLSLPFLFAFQKEMSWDRKIGDLSYPIYISHGLVISFAGIVMRILDLDYNFIPRPVVILIATVIISYLINYWIGRTIEKYRNKVRLHQRALE